MTVPIRVMTHNTGYRSLVRFVYTNHEGKIERRTVSLHSLEYGVFPFHPEPCWTIRGYCVDREADRTFDLSKIDMSTWEWVS